MQEAFKKRKINVSYLKVPASEVSMDLQGKLQTCDTDPCAMGQGYQLLPDLGQDHPAVCTVDLHRIAY